MSDQHRADAMGCAGDAVLQTPNIDRLAAGGARFTNAYCPFPLCGPSRMAFMTGRHPYEIGIWSNEHALNSDHPTFAHAFLAAGYETVLSGRMHFVGGDQRHGFERRLIGDVPECDYLSAGWKLSRVLGDLRDTPGCNKVGVLKSGPGESGYLAYDEAVTAATVDWLRQRSSESPFLLTVGYAMPHCPFVCRPDDFAYYAERIAKEDLPQQEAPLHPAMQRWQQACDLQPQPDLDAQWRTCVAYYGMCAHLDRQIGAVLAALEDAGELANTIIVYTSDHGEMLGDHGLWWKSTFYDGAAKVPFILSWPGHAPEGRAVSANASLIDIGETLCALAGIAGLPKASGRDLRPLLQGDMAPTWDDTIWTELARAGGPPQAVGPARMVRSGPWKYNFYYNDRPELFNVVEDPEERHDRWDDPDCREVLEEMHIKCLDSWSPLDVQRRLAWTREELKLCGKWVDKVQPPNADPLWFGDADPENRVDPVEQ